VSDLLWLTDVCETEDAELKCEEVDGNIRNVNIELRAKQIEVAELVYTTGDSLAVDLLTLVTDDLLTAEVTGELCIFVSFCCDVLIMLLTVFQGCFIIFIRFLRWW